jgi:hypothetical protein
MSGTKMTNLPDTISASQISQILQRAAEIDASGESLTVAELTRITDEAGIDRAATEAAIQEILGSDEAPGPSMSMVRTPKDTTLLSMSIGGGIGAALGLLSRLSLTLALPVVGGLAIYSLFQAVRSMRRKTPLEFQLQNLVSWFAMFMTAAAGLGSFEMENIFEVTAVAWLATSFIGGLLVRYGPTDPALTDAKLLENPEP